MNAEDRQREAKAHKEAFAEANKAAKDWSGTCKYCKGTVSGTIDECRAHKCPEYLEACGV